MRLLVLFAVAAFSAWALPIPDLYNTGDPRGVWLVNGSPAFLTDTSQYPFPYWHSAPAGTAWISPQPGYLVTGAGDGNNTTHVFSTSFTLPATFSEALIRMRVSTDNALTDVRLNGVSLGFATDLITLPGNASPMAVIAAATGFTNGLGAQLAALSGFRGGSNTLDFQVRNSFTVPSGVANPTGLLVSFESDVQQAAETDTPEPTTFGMFAAGAALLAVYARHRRA